MLGIAALGALTVLPASVTHFFPGALAAPLALLVTGIVLVVAALRTTRRRKRVPSTRTLRDRTGNRPVAIGLACGGALLATLAALTRGPHEVMTFFAQPATCWGTANVVLSALLKSKSMSSILFPFSCLFPPSPPPPPWAATPHLETASFGGMRPAPPDLSPAAARPGLANGLHLPKLALAGARDSKGRRGNRHPELPQAPAQDCNQCVALGTPRPTKDGIMTPSTMPRPPGVSGRSRECSPARRQSATDRRRGARRRQRASPITLRVQQPLNAEHVSTPLVRLDGGQDQ